MSAFGHKQSFRFYAYTCIITVNERLLSANSGHWLTVNTEPQDDRAAKLRAADYLPKDIPYNKNQRPTNSCHKVDPLLYDQIMHPKSKDQNQ